MGVDILKEELTSPAVEDATEQSKSEKRDQPEIEKTVNFGTLDSGEETNGVVVPDIADAKNGSFPKDAVDEWPAPKQIHTFYFVKYQPYEDPKLKARFEQVEKEIQKRNVERSQILDALKEKRAERQQIISQLKPLTNEDKQFRMVIDGKRKEMEPLQAALGKLRVANNAERGMGICSSEEELDGLIQSLEYRIQHESNTLSEEKQLLKDIKGLEGTRERVIAYAAMKTKLQDSLGPKDAIQDQVKLIGVDLDGVRKEKNAVRSRIKSLEDVLRTIDEDIASLQEKLAEITQKRDKTYETLNELRKTREGGNASYYQCRSTLNNARDLAAKKDVAALEELCNNEVTKFISQWSRDKAFRDDYEKRILLSLDKRQLSRDGRMRNPDEKPILAEPSAPTKASIEAPQPLSVKKKGVDIDLKQPKAADVVVAPKEEKEKLAGSRANFKGDTTPDDTESFYLPEKPSRIAVPAVDIEKLKEMKREEEVAKARQAQERKKKLAEKAAAKAAARALKEAEKKQKEKEKKAKKKAEVVTGEVDKEQSDDPKEEQESDDLKETVLPSKAREPKENPRHRGRARGLDGRPKITIPRKKRTQPYWKWAAAALASLLVLAVLGFFYFYYSPTGRK